MNKPTIPTVDLASTDFQPKNEYLLVFAQPLEQEVDKKSQGGIIMPAPTRSSLDRPTSGTVIAVGRDIDDILPGDFVLWPGTDGLDMEFTDGVHMILRYKSIIGPRKA